MCEKYFMKIIDYAPESKNNLNEGQPSWEQGQDRDLDVVGPVSAFPLGLLYLIHHCVMALLSQVFSCGSNMATFAQLLNTVIFS